MKSMKRGIALVLVLAMMLSILPMAFAADSFEKTRQWTAGQFTDVIESDWYYDTVKGAYELGLMNGDPSGTFRPKGQVTLAETVTVAARIHSIANTGEENFVQGDPWYGVYVSYALTNGILTQDIQNYNRPATRQEFASILAKSLPEKNLTSINTVEDGAIPDVADDAAVYLLYRAGILTGSDKAGTFHPNSNIKRSEVAAIISRMALPDLREKITLTNKTEDIPATPEQPEQPDTPAVPVDPDIMFPDPEELENITDEIPFDQQYPDLINNGTVDFSGEQIMIKFENDPGFILQGKLALKGVTKLEKLFDAANGVWYLAYTNSNVTDVLEKVREIDDVLVAEYDYAYSTESTIIECTPDEMDEDVKGNGKHKDQWYLRSCGIQNGLGHLKHNHKHGHGPNGECLPDQPGDDNIGIAGEGIVVAVIDTGVDYNHEDLKDNIWFNAKEIPDNGKDDDGNGFIDDYYGYDAVARKGSGMDDNGHGTHVAGIISGVNNNMGVVGIAYNAKIMPVKAGQSSGYFNQSDIAQAINYAYLNGADVINMSFGGNASSIAMTDALTMAYTDCVLVAAAGNEGENNELSPFYPAAFTYVLGVMSVDQTGAVSPFSNWDLIPFNSREYELYAPGSSIESTIPGNKYASWSGTSMAAPMVSAMAALLRANFYDPATYPTKFIYGQLAATGDTVPQNAAHDKAKIANLELALTVMPKPSVNVTDYLYFDTPGLQGNTLNNGDGVIDAGETIALGFELRNQWGMSDQTTITVDTLTQAGLSNPYVDIDTPSVNYGPVGTYSTQNGGWIMDDQQIVGIERPIYLTVDPDCPDDYTIKLNVHTSSTNGLDETDKTLYTEEFPLLLQVRRGVVLPSLIEKDMTLNNQQQYLIPNAVQIAAGATVRVEPGAKIQFWSANANDPYATTGMAYLDVRGTLLLKVQFSA